MLKNFIEQTINGIQVGSIYALIALGYTMVFAKAAGISVGKATRPAESLQIDGRKKSAAK